MALPWIRSGPVRHHRFRLASVAQQAWPGAPGTLAGPVAPAVERLSLEAPMPAVHAALPPVTWPAARRVPLPPHQGDGARGLRRLFWRERGPDFLAARSPERLLLDLLRAPDRSSAEALESSLGPLFLEPDQRRLVDEACDLAAGSSLSRERWGEEPALDALRTRLVRDLGPQVALQKTGAEGLLWWLGSLAPELPARARAVLVAACASRHGWPAALGLALRPAAGLSLARRFDLASLAVLRCTLEGRFRLQWLPALLPPPALARRRDLRGRSPWAAALIVLDTCVRNADDGAFHVAVALAASAFRLAVFERARVLEHPCEALAWGRSTASQRESFAGAARALLEAGWTPHASESPWRAPWPPFRVGEFERMLVDVSGLPARRAWLLLADDGLATALAFALAGAAPSARTVLASSPCVDALRGIAFALDGALDRPLKQRSPLDLLVGALDAEARHQVSAASEADPSIVLGAPYWRVRGGYAATIAWLMRSGRGQAFRDVKRVLRPDLEPRARPYWLLTEQHDAEIASAVSWAARSALPPDDAPFLVLLEKTWTRINPGPPRSRP